MKSFVKRAALAVVLFAIPYANSFNLPSTHRHVINKLHSEGRRSSGGGAPLYSTLEKKSKSSNEEIEDFPNPEDVAALVTPPEPSTNILGKPIPYSELTIGILKESYPGENRVSVAPESVKLLVDAGLNVVVESGGELVIFIISSFCVGCTIPVRYSSQI